MPRQERVDRLALNTLDRGTMPLDRLTTLLEEHAAAAGSCHDIMACANGECKKIAEVCNARPVNIDPGSVV